MGISLIYNNNDNKLKDISELAGVELDNNIEASVEGLKINTIAGCETPDEAPRNNRTNAVMFSKILSKDGKKADWCFVLDNRWPPEHYTEFVLQMTAVQPEDSVFIHGPESCTNNAANCIVGAIISCKSKDISISIPYIFNLGSAYVLSYAKKIVHSPYDVMICKADDIFTGGGIGDSEAALDMFKYELKTMTERLVNKGLLTASEEDHIVNAQGQIACYCGDLVRRYSEFNKKSIG